MSIQEIRNVVGEKICLFGGFDLTNFFDLNDVELLEKVRVIIELGRKYGPYVFGTSAGILDDNLNPDKVKMVYSAAR
jgi:uroporphyrinogen decarboxylase